MGGRRNIVFGWTEDLDGDTITGFGATDLVVAQGAAFTPDAMRITAGSAILTVNQLGADQQEFELRL